MQKAAATSGCARLHYALQTPLFKRDCSSQQVHSHSLRHIQGHDTTRWSQSQWNLV